MVKKKAKAKSNKNSKNKSKNTKQRTSFKDWFKSHKKRILLTSYYSGAAIVIASSIYVIMSNLTKTEDVTRDEPISFITEYVDTDELELGTEEVEREGEDGVKKVTYREKSYLLSGKVIDSFQMDFETTKEPVSKLVKRGTRRWQYMICSDGGWMFYSDEQFKDKNVGFTHASEDACAKDGKGTAVALADSPSSSSPTVSSYSGSSGSGLTDDYVRAMEIIAERERELRNNETNNVSGTEPFTGSTTNSDPFAEERARQEAERQARSTAESTCRSQAERARDSARRQLGAMGVGGSELTTVPQGAYDSTYSSCMRGYGY